MRFMVGGMGGEGILSYLLDEMSFFRWSRVQAFPAGGILTF